jgi:hypothetical protein
MEWRNWNGKDLSELTRNNWADELCKKVQSSDEQYNYIVCGDSVIFACKTSDGVQVFDCKLVRRAELANADSTDSISYTIVPRFE